MSSLSQKAYVVHLLESILTLITWRQIGMNISLISNLGYIRLL